TIAGGDARVLTYSTCLFCTLPSLWRSHNPSYVKCDRYIQQALSINSGKDFRSIEPMDVEAIVQRTEWVNLWKWEKLDFLEILLQLGWGKPEEAYYKRGWPTSGSEYIHAVKPGQKPIC
ncbi:MAG: hypothetical protein ACBR21_29940, partial [Microcoleus sp.]